MKPNNKHPEQDMRDAIWAGARKRYELNDNTPPQGYRYGFEDGHAYALASQSKQPETVTNTTVEEAWYARDEKRNYLKISTQQQWRREFEAGWKSAKLYNKQPETLQSDEVVERLKEDFEWERNKLREEWYERRQSLEMQYAEIKRHNDYLMQMIVDSQILQPPALSVIQPVPASASVDEVVEGYVCKTCNGYGECDDADLGDMYYNKWECADCDGKGGSGIAGLIAHYLKRESMGHVESDAPALAHKILSAMPPRSINFPGEDEAAEIMAKAIKSSGWSIAPSACAKVAYRALLAHMTNKGDGDEQG